MVATSRPARHRQAEPPHIVLALVRDDALPDGADYRDEGCDLHPACLTCPFERCRYDDAPNPQARLVEEVAS